MAEPKKEDETRGNPRHRGTTHLFDGFYKSEGPHYTNGSSHVPLYRMALCRG